MKRVVFVVFDGFQSLDLTGPFEVFSFTGRYECLVVAPEAGEVRARSGLPFVAGHGVRDLDPAGPFDTLITVGGAGVDAAARDETLVGWVRDAARGARRVASVCSGVLLLGAAGLLDGRR
ncbi:DJ-1/PfpI family protein, partial [Spirillospora sp. NPDC049652]